MVAGVGINLLTDANTSQFIYGDRRIPVWQLASGLGGGASLISNFVSGVILPHIPHNEKSQNMESMVLNAVSSAGVFYFVPKFLNPDLTSNEGVKFAMAGVVAEAIASYINDMALAVEESEGIVF